MADDDAPPSSAETAEQIDAVMAALQALVGVAAQSVSEVEHQVTLPQLRVLVLIATRGTLNLNALAAAMGIHASNASRSCDRLVAAGLLRRDASPLDRRQLVLGLTDAGEALVEMLTAHRRHVVAGILERVPESRRAALVDGMHAFASAAGDSPGSNSWRLGWH